MVTVMEVKETRMEIATVVKETHMAIAMAERLRGITIIHMTMTTIVIEINIVQAAIEKEKTSMAVAHTVEVITISALETEKIKIQDPTIKEDQIISLTLTWAVHLKITTIEIGDRGLGPDLDQAAVKNQTQVDTVATPVDTEAKLIQWRIMTTSRTRTTGVKRGRLPQRRKLSLNVHMNSGALTR